MEQARRSTTQWRRRAVQVGGDSYDAFQVSDGSTELTVGDVSGHDEAAAVMAQVRNVLRGIAPERPRRNHAQTLGPVATVVLYTDGLAERRGPSLDDGTELLRTTATRLARAGLTLDQLCDTLLAELGGAFDDGVALLAVRAHPEDRPRPPEAGPSVEPADLRGR